MFCSNCGKEVKEGRFCTLCGSQIIKPNKAPQMVLKEKEIKQTGNEKKRRISSGGIVGLLVLLVIGLFVVWSALVAPDPSERFIEILKTRTKEEAEEYYKWYVLEDKQEFEKAYDMAVKEINAFVDGYYADSLSYNEVKNYIEKYRHFYKPETDEAWGRIIDLKYSKDKFASAEEKFESKEYREAYGYYEEVIEEDSNINIAKERMAECSNIIATQAFATSEAAANEGNWILAISCLKDEIKLFNDEDIVAANDKIEVYMQAYVAEKESLINSYEEQKDYAAAFDTINSALGEIGKNDELNRKSQMLTESYENYITEQIVEKIKNRDVQAATDILNIAKEEKPHNEVFIALTELVAEYNPVSLFEQEPFQKSTHFDRSPYIGRLDNQGNEYEYMYTCGGIYIKDADWKLDGKYDLLTGVVGVPSGYYYATGVNGIVQIYGDGKLLWEKTGIDAATAPENISVNVSGVDVIQIYMKGGIADLKHCSVMVADFMVQKTEI